MKTRKQCRLVKTLISTQFPLMPTRGTDMFPMRNPGTLLEKITNLYGPNRCRYSVEKRKPKIM